MRKGLSLASQFPHLNRVSQLQIVRLTRRHRQQASSHGNAKQDQKIAAFGSSYSWIVGIRWKLVDQQGAIASRARTENQSSAAARGKAAPLNNERKLECF